MSRLPLIPSAPSAKWRIFRTRWVPVIVFVAGACGSLVLWRSVGTSSTLPGVGEGVRSIVASPQPALLQQLFVEPYQLVNQGDPIATIVAADPRIQFDLLRSELDLARMRVQPSIAEENAMNFERIRVELLRTKSELAIAKVKLELARKDVARNTPLYKEKLVAEDIYELSLNIRDAYQVEVEEKAKAISEIEGRLESLSGLGDPLSGAANEQIVQLESKLRGVSDAAATNFAPIILTAPVTGMIGAIQRHAGEYVIAGEPLVIINSLWSDRVVGYLRQPYMVDPEVGMPVLVTTRTRERKRFHAQITQVGAHVESITNSLAYLRPGFLTDAGLPIVVALPANIQIRPGEVVDLLIRSRHIETVPDANPLPEARSEPKKTHL